MNCKSTEINIKQFVRCARPSLIYGHWTYFPVIIAHTWQRVAAHHQIDVKSRANGSGWKGGFLAYDEKWKLMFIFLLARSRSPRRCSAVLDVRQRSDLLPMLSYDFVTGGCCFCPPPTPSFPSALDDFGWNSPIIVFWWLAKIQIYVESRETWIENEVERIFTTRVVGMKPSWRNSAEKTSQRQMKIILSGQLNHQSTIDGRWASAKKEKQSRGWHWFASSLIFVIIKSN